MRETLAPEVAKALWWLNEKGAQGPGSHLNACRVIGAIPYGQGPEVEEKAKEYLSELNPPGAAAVLIVAQEFLRAAKKMEARVAKGLPIASPAFQDPSARRAIKLSYNSTVRDLKNPEFGQFLGQCRAVVNNFPDLAQQLCSKPAQLSLRSLKIPPGLL